MSLSSHIRRALGFAAAAVLTLAASAVFASTQLTGAGSTFDYPFFSKAFYEYSQQRSDVTVNYQSIGSGGGIQQFIAKTVDFGASDVPMNAEELKLAQGPVLQVPVTLGGAAMGYNLPGIGKGLRLTRQLIADIFLGKVTKWNDPAIVKLNSGMKLPDMPITVVHRSDGSGTTYIFTDFLSSVSPEWKQKVGTGKSVQWPVGLGGKGNEGVAGQVRQTPGAIGYIELAYVLENEMTYAQVENKAGTFVYPSIETVADAAASKPGVNATDFSIVDAAGANSYPISGYSWVMLYEKPSDAARAKLVKQTLEWLVTKGQSVAKSVDYVPLPDNVQKQALKVISQMQA
ncbi:MAG: phosphate ABC transporter substrate-binding protein PstS [Candidatus Binataceae bacterium]